MMVPVVATAAWMASNVDPSAAFIDAPSVEVNAPNIVQNAGALKRYPAAFASGVEFRDQLVEDGAPTIGAGHSWDSALSCMRSSERSQ